MGRQAEDRPREQETSMSIPFRAVLGLAALAVVAACAPRPEPVVFEPAPAVGQQAPYSGKFGK